MSSMASAQTADPIPAALRQFGAGANSRVNHKLVFRAAEKSIEFFDHLRAHYRETRRTSVEIPCDVKLVLPDASTFDSGTATVKNVSPSGAMIAGLKLSKGCLPVGVFKVVLTLRGDEYKGIGIEATPVRIISDAAGLGLRFDEIFVSV